MKLHELRLSAKSFQALWSSRRTFVHVSDDVKQEDVIHAMETDDNEADGERSILFHVTDVAFIPPAPVGIYIASVKLLARLTEAAASLSPEERP